MAVDCPVDRIVVMAGEGEWCASCHRLEGDLPGDFRPCLECGHVFRTAEELLEAENKLRRMFNERFTDTYFPPVTDVETIHSCPLCTHDW